MAEPNEILKALNDKLIALSQKQDNFYREINALRQEIARLSIDEAAESKNTVVANEENKTESEVEPITTPRNTVENSLPIAPSIQNYPRASARRSKSELERFIGENLINKVGIIITVIGVSIGAKYSIDHQLISPLTRIILGYIMGLGLLGFGIKLKKDYENYSSVLVSGAIAILYFITYAAYGFYALMPQLMAFLMMLVFTVFAVVASINYNKPIIAHLGLVGAYAVPFLLSNGSGKIEVLFTYMAIINVGILFIAFKRYWKSLYYSSFLLTWLIFSGWYVAKFDFVKNFALTNTFLTIFFFTFYALFLGYKLIRKEKFDFGDIVLLLANSFIFYAVGYSIIDSDKSISQLLGLFTLGNATIHFVVCSIIYRQQLADRNLFFFVAGLVLVFITIAIPVQLEGNWVTLLWTAEAALLFWIGRTKQVNVYESLSYILIFLAFGSLLQDWTTSYDTPFAKSNSLSITPFLNSNFLTSAVFIALFGLINGINRNASYWKDTQNGIASIMNIFIPAIFLIATYLAFRLEIANYWDSQFNNSMIKAIRPGESDLTEFYNYDLSKFKTLWILNYSLLFVALISFFNIHKIRSRSLGQISLFLTCIAGLVFLVQGLYTISLLRDSYLDEYMHSNYPKNDFNVYFRYISFAFFAFMVLSIFYLLKQTFMEPIKKALKIWMDLLFYIALVWILSSELIAWMDIVKSIQSYKLGLSILWGVYALYLISIGIWKRKQHLRVGAIVLFGVTLVKLFFYDISHLNTISKTIVFVSLGLLLLTISFLYNKYKNLMSDEPMES